MEGGLPTRNKRESHGDPSVGATCTPLCRLSLLRSAVQVEESPPLPLRGTPIPSANPDQAHLSSPPFMPTGMDGRSPALGGHCGVWPAPAPHFPLHPLRSARAGHMLSPKAQGCQTSPTSKKGSFRSAYGQWTEQAQIVASRQLSLREFSAKSVFLQPWSAPTQPSNSAPPS